MLSAYVTQDDASSELATLHISWLLVGPPKNWFKGPVLRISLIGPVARVERAYTRRPSLEAFGRHINDNPEMWTRWSSDFRPGIAGTITLELHLDDTEEVWRLVEDAIRLGESQIADF
jgi:hypothetical protein